MVKSKDYNSVLNNFKASFPAKFLIDQYPAKDFLFNLVYENGMYQIGPLNEEDAFMIVSLKYSIVKTYRCRNRYRQLSDK